MHFRLRLRSSLNDSTNSTKGTTMTKQAPPRKHTPVTAEAVKRVQQAVALQNNGQTPKGSLAAKLQSVYDKKQNSSTH